MLQLFCPIKIQKYIDLGNIFFQKNSTLRKPSRSLSQTILTTILVLFVFSVETRAQKDNTFFSNASLAEKIYLQFDGNIYTAGNIVWFKCVVLNANNHFPTSLSSVLYVELITPEEIIREKKLVKLTNGIGQGYFYLDKNLPEGLYQIRAYTNWNKNFGTDYFFEEYFRVFASGKKNDEEKPINRITLIKEGTNKNRLEAQFNPLLIDSAHKDKLTVVVMLDDRKDTLSVKKEKDDTYRINYTIVDESKFATLQMQTGNNQKYSTTVVLDENAIDFQFFPESGELVHGLRGTIGFKALDANGQGKQVEGDIVDEKDSVFTSFKSNELGMGIFMLNEADNAKTYYARLKFNADDDQILLFQLPPVAPMGNILSVEKLGDDFLLSAVSNYLENDSIILNLSFRGVNLYEKKAGLKNGVFMLLVPVKELPEGIISCTISDAQGHPVAERLFFNERPESRLNIEVSIDKYFYAIRELTQLNIKTTNTEDEPINANLSVLVINKQQLGKMQSTRQNILSYFLLNSELKGKIENPGFYFRNDKSMFNDLDALMLTQGWRKYNYSKDYTELSFQPESNLTVSGQVSSVFSTKRKKQAELTMMTFGENKSIYTENADSLGKFKFNMDDEYGQEMNVLIQTSKKSGKNIDYTILLDKFESPPVEYNQTKTVEKIDSVVQVLVEKNEERKKIDEAFPMQSGEILLNEVMVTALKLTPERKKVIEKYGEPDEIIDGKEIQAKEEKWSYGLYSVLLFNYSDKVIIERARNGVLYAQIIGADGTLVVVDGRPVKFYDYGFIPSIPASEVSSFEINKCAKNFLSLYLEVFGALPPNPPLCGGVISIFTHGGKGIYAQSPIGLTQATVPVFSAPREFYAPKYDNTQSDAWNIPDLRALVHWEPELITDSLGKTSTSFYNADNVGEMVVVIEAVSDDGKIGYTEAVYAVEGEEKKIIIVN